MQRVASTGFLGFGIALGLHGLMLAALFGMEAPEPPKVERRAPVKIRVLQRPKPQPKPEPKPEQAAEKKPEPTPEKKPAPKAADKPRPKPKAEKKPEPKKLAKLEPKPQAKTQTPPPAPEAKPKATSEPIQQTRKPRKFTVSMEATVSGGGVAVPTGSGGTWAYGSADGDPDGERVLTSGNEEKAPPGPPPPRPPSQPRRATEVTTLPKLLRPPSAGDLRKFYPEQARRDGVEANVYLKILVSPAGQVVQVQIVKSAGRDFDDAAKKLVSLFRFEPGTQGDRAVAVWIPWTYKFRLDG